MEEIDSDHSATVFSPRKGTIVHVFKHPLKKEAIVVELSPRAIRYFPYPHRLTHIVLQYFQTNNESIYDTFRKGGSYCEVLELRNKKALTRETLAKRDVSHLGAATILEWPKPSTELLNKRQ